MSERIPMTQRGYDAIKEELKRLKTRERPAAVKAIRLARAEVVDTSSMLPDRVRFGTRVVLEDADSGEEIVYTLVGEDEADITRGLLSVTSPVGRALIGKQVDDEVSVSVPAGKRTYEVREIGAME